MNITIDLSSILSGCCLAAILYVARTLSALEKNQAVATEKAGQQEKEMIELRQRTTTVEAEVAAIKVHVARFTAAAGIDP